MGAASVFMAYSSQMDLLQTRVLERFELRSRRLSFLGTRYTHDRMVSHAAADEDLSRCVG